MLAFFVSWHPRLWIWKWTLCYNSTQHHHKIVRCKEGSESFILSQKGECTSIVSIDTAKVKTERIRSITKSEEIIVSTSENQVQQNYSNNPRTFSNISFLHIFIWLFFFNLKMGIFIIAIN